MPSPIQPKELLRCRLQCDSLAPQLAREALQALDVIYPVRDDALLIASELVTNAVLHSGCEPTDELEVAADLISGGVVIAVTDVGRTARTPSARMNAPGQGGFGLRIVDTLARRWGSERRDGLRVWAEIALDG